MTLKQRLLYSIRGFLSHWMPSIRCKSEQGSIPASDYFKQNPAPNHAVS